MPLLLASFNDFQTILSEGIFDPGILKCVIMAGGPGSGKSYVAADLFGIDRRFKASFSSFGLKLVNSDPEFERLLKQMGVSPKDLANIERDNPELFQDLTSSPTGPRERAKKLTKARHGLYLQGRLGLILDGTGENVQKIAFQKHEAEGYGYDTFMIFVNTSLETSLARNRQRERQMPDALVKQIWNTVQANIDSFSDIFGDNFIIVNNDGRQPDDMAAIINKIIRRFVRQPVQNSLGRAWIQAAQMVAAA